MLLDPVNPSQPSHGVAVTGVDLVVLDLATALAAADPNSDPGGRDINFYLDQVRTVVASLPALGYLHVDRVVRIADDAGMTADRRGTYAAGQRRMALRIIGAIRDEARG